MTQRASVLQSDGSWLGYTDSAGLLTPFGMPMHWYDGSWHQVTPPTMGYDADGNLTVIEDPGGYDHVYTWNGAAWVPWSSTVSWNVGTPWEALNDGSNISTHTFASLPTGSPVMITAGLGIAAGGAPDDFSYQGGFFELSNSPTWPFGIEDNAGYGSRLGSCHSHNEEALASDVAMPLSMWATFDQAHAGAEPADRNWVFPYDEAALYYPNAIVVLLPLGVVGVTRVDTYQYGKCVVGADSLGNKPANVNKIRFLSLPNARAAGCVLRFVITWNSYTSGGADPGAPGVIPAPAGYTELYQGTWNRPGPANDYANLRLAVFWTPVSAGDPIPEAEVDLGNDATAKWDGSYLGCSVSLL